MHFSAELREKIKLGATGIMAAPFEKGGFTHAIWVQAVSDAAF
jgi:hypothetical protein